MVEWLVSTVITTATAMLLVGIDLVVLLEAIVIAVALRAVRRFL